MLSDEEQDRLDHAIAVLSEHFPNYAVAVLSVENELLSVDYSSWRVGRMLFRDALEDMEHEKEMSLEMAGWDDWEDDENYE